MGHTGVGTGYSVTKSGAETQLTEGGGAGEYVTQFRGHRLIWHGGNHTGSTVENWILPDDRMSITVLCNGGFTAVPQLIRAIAALYIPQNDAATPKPADVLSPPSGQKKPV